MAIKNNGLTIGCDFCDAEMPEPDYKKQVGGWSWGQRGIVYPNVSICALQQEMKHACSKELCKAKLLVWARS